MAQGILLDRSKVLEVKVEEDRYNVVYGFHQLASFKIDDRISRRISIVQLIGMGVSKNKLCNVFNINHMSIDLWQGIYKEGGMEALVSLQAGPKVKVTEAIKGYVFALYKKLKGKRGTRKRIIEEVEELYGEKISRETVRRIVNEKKSQGVVVEAEETESESKKKDTAIVEESKEVMVRHGGALIALPILDKYNVNEMIISESGEGGGGYSFYECVFSIVLLLTARLLRVEENIKLHDDELMGGLIGHNRLPSLRTVRRMMTEMIEGMGDRVEGLKVLFALTCISMWKYKNPFYIDGHFMPYGGGERILFGFNPQRQLAEKGRTAYVVNTADGRPIYEVLSDGYDNFSENIEKIINFLRDEMRIPRPTIVFDRGGFSWDFFEAIEEKADFICWYKGKAAPGKKAKWLDVKMPMESNIYGVSDFEVLQCTEKVIEGGDKKGKGYRRLFFVKKGEKISPAISNIRNESLEDLVLKLTRRWGAQENVFKELVEDGYNSIHTYDKSKFGDGFLDKEGLDIKRTMENPEYRKVQKEKRKLQNRRDQILGGIARKEKELKRQIGPTKKQAEQLDEIEKKLVELKERLSYLPEEILRIDFIKDNGINRLSSNKKKYFDLLNFLAFNVRKDIVEIIGPIYRDNRDVHQIAIKILRMSVKLKYSAGETKVIFSSPHRRKEKDALIELCDFLTSQKCSSSLFLGKLVYSVS